jgi:hypothetical protein
MRTAVLLLPPLLPSLRMRSLWLPPLLLLLLPLLLWWC